MVSINTIGITVYTTTLVLLYIFVPTKIQKKIIYGSEYVSGDKIKIKDIFFKPYGFRDIMKILKTSFLTPFMLFFYVSSILLITVFNLREINKIYPLYLLSYLIAIVLYIFHSGVWMFDETGGIFGDSMIVDEIEGREDNKMKNRQSLMNYRKIYSPKWIVILILIPIYVTLFVNGVKFFKNEFLTMGIMLLCIMLSAIFL